MNVDDYAPTMSTQEAAAIWGISADQLYRVAKRHEAPVEPLYFGSRRLRWPTQQVLATVGITVPEPSDGADVVPITGTGS